MIAVKEKTKTKAKRLVNDGLYCLFNPVFNPRMYETMKVVNFKMYCAHMHPYTRTHVHVVYL